MASKNSISLIPKLNSIATIPLLIVSLVIELFLLVDGSYFFGNLWSSYEPVLTLYLIISSGLMAFAYGMGKSLLSLTFFDALMFFVPAFLITGIAIGQFTTGFLSSYTTNYIVVQIIFQIFVVSITEELMFRGILIKYIGVIPQAILFAVFHLVAYTTLYGLNISAFISAFIMGILLGYIVYFMSKNGMESQSLAIAWGIHAGWNVAVATGIFSLAGVI